MPEVVPRSPWLIVPEALNYRVAPPRSAARHFHRSFPGYHPTPLRAAPRLARRCALGTVWVKDESTRLGLPSFKILGASWAIARALAARVGRSSRPTTDEATFEALRELARQAGELVLVTATDGNHGRAVAHVARMLGLRALVYVPAGTSVARTRAIEAEGAACEVVGGTYEDAVARAAATADESHLVISDTALDESDEIPRWVIEGYATIFEEIDEQLEARDRASWPDTVVVPAGVGALAAAAVNHYRSPNRETPVHLVVVEPVVAACLLTSATAGELRSIEGGQDSIMAGLNCGRPSAVAWPAVSCGVDTYVAIEDVWAERAMQVLSEDEVVAGETGAAAAGALLAMTAGTTATTATAESTFRAVAEWLDLGAHSRVLALCTEGATDPEAYRRIVRRDLHEPLIASGRAGSDGTAGERRAEAETGPASTDTDDPASKEHDQRWRPAMETSEEGM